MRFICGFKFITCLEGGGFQEWREKEKKRVGLGGGRKGRINGKLRRGGKKERTVCISDKEGV